MEYRGQLGSVFTFSILLIVLILVVCYNICSDNIVAGNRVTGWLTFILHRMGVMLMKDNFDFEDLMAFGMFLLALLTFIYLICH